MKYGDTLAQRSVPEWLPYNLDYIDIKHLIKRHTTAHQPVDDPAEHTVYENELFNVFADQLDRITLFVKSKSGEIDSRLASCRRQINTIKRRKGLRSVSKTASWYAKVEREVERAGYDVQCLARFVVVQHTGFRKLLKKYRKWSGSNGLSQRFGVLLDSPYAFHRTNFDPVILNVSELLATVRDGIDRLADEPLEFQDITPPHSRPGGLVRRNTYSSIAPVMANEPDNVPGRAVFWVHYDHLIELQLVLLKHLIIQSSTPNQTAPSTPALSRTNSSFGATPGKEDETVTISLDDISKYSQSLPREAVGRINWRNQAQDARIRVMTGLDSVLETRLKNKHIDSTIRPQSGNIRDKNPEVEMQARLVQQWFGKHPEVKPLVKTWFKRTRFVGHAPDGFVWVFVDRDVKSCALDGSEDCTSEAAEGDDSHRTSFPHAICQIRWSSSVVPSIVEELRQSYLVKEVDSFSMDVHAITTFYGSNNGIIQPPWFEDLKKDIRVTPPPRRDPARRSSSHAIVHNTSSKSSSATEGTADTSIHESLLAFEGTHTPGNRSSSSSQRRKFLKPVQKRMIVNISGNRYWNELEGDGSDAEGQAYTVLVTHSDGTDDEDDDNTLSEYLSNSMRRSVGSIRKALGFPRRTRQSDERTHLLHNSANDADGESSSDEEGRVSPQYGTYPSVRRRREIRRRMGAHILAMGGSIVLLAVGMALALDDAATGRKNRRKEPPSEHLLIDFGVLASVIGSLGLAVLALSIFLLSIPSPAFVHSFIVWTVFLVVMAGSGAVVALQGRTEVDG